MLNLRRGPVSAGCSERRRAERPGDAERLVPDLREGTCVRFQHIRLHIDERGGKSQVLQAPWLTRRSWGAEVIELGGNS